MKRPQPMSFKPEPPTYGGYTPPSSNPFGMDEPRPQPQSRDHRDERRKFGGAKCDCPKCKGK